MSALCTGLALYCVLVGRWPGRRSAVKLQYKRSGGSWRWPRQRTAGDLGDAALEIAAALQAGLDLDEAAAALAHVPPWSQYVNLRRTGMPLAAAVEQTVTPVWPDLATLLLVHDRYGGPLADMLLALADSASQRKLRASELRARTSEARASALLLASTGPGLGLYLLWRQPFVLAPLVQHPVGTLALLAAALLWAVGIVSIQRLLRPLQ